MKKISVLFLIVLMCTGCSMQPVSVTDFALDTSVTVTLYGGDEETARECIDLCKKYENLFSKTLMGSDIWNINQSGSAEVTDETTELIKKAEHYSELSDGLFDISVGGASRLWDFDEKIIPDKESLCAAVQNINHEDILISGNTITVKDGMSLDVGGIAKGYIADKMKEFLKAQGIESGIINLGGNVLCIGDKNGKPFEIGIQKPYAPGETVRTLSVSDKSVVTAGIYERSFEKDGVLYHHILDPKTGYPVQNNLASVTVVTEKSVDGDALSTALFLMGEEKGIEFAKENNISAVFVTKNMEVIRINTEKR